MNKLEVNETPEISSPFGEPLTVKMLLEAGVHFGHQRKRWNPKMKEYVFTQRNGIHIIDLQQTLGKLEEARVFVRDLIADGGDIVFVGTKKQAKDAIEEEARRCGAYYVSRRWLGGTLTNFSTVQSRIDYLVRLEDRQAKGELASLPKKEESKLEREINRLNQAFGGIKEMTQVPSAMFVVDPMREKIAIAEATQLGVPIVAMVDTDCDPAVVDYPIPANDDAIKSIWLICTVIANAVLEGKAGAESFVPSAEDATAGGVGEW